MSVIETLVNLFAPNECLGCGREGSLLCRPCACLLTPPSGRCFSCRQSLKGGVSCATCLFATDLLAATVYQGISKALVAQLKFHGNRSAARTMAAHLYQQIPLALESVLVHVPATTAHIRRRGYDQSELIVKYLARYAGLPRLRAIGRFGYGHQLGSGRQTRLHRAGEAMYLRRPATVRGRHIVLVDDVVTTGASLRAASELLFAAGATTVTCLAFAQA